MSSFNYITKDNDRWDLLGFKFYGDIKGQTTLMDANISVPLDPVLPQGITLIIPIIDDTESSIITENLPPWK